VAVHQRSLFAGGAPGPAPGAVLSRHALDDSSWVDVGRGWLLGADTLLDDLAASVPWTQGRRRMYDRLVDDPRLSHRYGPGAALPHPVLDEVRAALAEHYRVGFGAVGLNFYRDGADSVAPHRDRELRERDADSLVAVLTLGARRPFRLASFRRRGPGIDLSPGSGDLLVMGGRCQRDWTHGVPKVASAGPRISCTWRGSAG
jgi:alkylated DNA repair dioxygenase AlkB